MPRFAEGYTSQDLDGFPSAVWEIDVSPHDEQALIEYLQSYFDEVRVVTSTNGQAIQQMSQIDVQWGNP